MGSISSLNCHTLSCTIKDEVCAKEYESIYFGSFDEVIKVDALGCLNEGKARRLEGLEGGSSGRACRAQSSHKTATFQ